MKKVQSNISFIFGVIVSVCVVFFILIVLIITIVPTGFVGVKYTMGKANEKELKPGIHFVFPFFQSIQLMDVRMRTINYLEGHTVKKYEEGITEKNQITIMDKSSLPIEVELTLQYRLKSVEAAETLQEYGANYEEKLVNPVVRNVVRSAFGKYEAQFIPDKRSEIEGAIKSGITDKFLNLPVEMRDVQLRNIRLDDTILARIKEVQKKTQEVQIAKQELEKAQINAERQRVEAEAKANAQVETSKGYAQAIKIEAAANAEKIKLQYEAEAEGAKLLREALSPVVVESKLAEKWDGKLPTITGGSTILVPSDIFKAFQSTSLASE